VAAVHELVAKKRFDTDVKNLRAAAAGLGFFINGDAYPVLDVTIQHTRPLRLVLTAPEWDQEPPSIALRNVAGQPMPGPFPGGIFNPGPHPTTQLPFVCMPGSKEFHTHPGHTNETWEGFRGTSAKTLTGIVMQLGQEWKDRVT
jgi:hypothetical protein